MLSALGGYSGWRIPPSESGRAALFRSWVADRRVLVVVVVRNVADARELESLLPAGAACGSIVTCAAALQRRPGSHDVWLTSLDAQAIVRRCGYLPGLIVKSGHCWQPPGLGFGLCGTPVARG